jgi:hypothetical protein
MTVVAIYRPDLAGSREPLKANSKGQYTLVDTRIPYQASGCRTNLRNRADMAVKANSLDEAALLLTLGYAVRVTLANGQTNYLTEKDLVIERR